MNIKNDSSRVLLKAENLSKNYSTKRGILKAVDEVSFELFRGETLGCAGESGCGKSTLALLILRLIEATKGKVFFKNSDIFSLKTSEMNLLRKDIQIVFQDPYSSLPPGWTVHNIIIEPMRIFNAESKDVKSERVFEILSAVGLQKLTKIDTYPDQLSGGERQRVAIARALVMKPSLVVLDEPISSLDVSIQSQILNLLLELKSKYELSYFFITHDLRVLRYLSDRIAIMYLGRIVEIASNDDLFSNPLHPYTNSLIESSPSMEKRLNVFNIEFIKSEFPSPFEIMNCCGFNTRCSNKKDICISSKPKLTEVSSGHFVACHLF
jgi:oligopeptide/dipeptide ABC transporter ATP-binding protein